MHQDKQYYLDNVGNMDNRDIAAAISDGHVTFEELQDTGDFATLRQQEVRKLLGAGEQENNDFNAATDIHQLEQFLVDYPNSRKQELVIAKINALKEEKAAKLNQELQKYIDNPNLLFIEDDPIRKLGEDNVRELCGHYGIDFKIVKEFRYATLNANYNHIPKSKDEIPDDFTDVYFWGTSTSGKTCALAAILSTMNKKYNIVDPVGITMGNSYRNDLTRVFLNDIACLPNRTPEESTQYMPFQFKKRDRRKYKNVSFFELSGELFKYFYEVITGVKKLDEDKGEKVLEAFETVKLLVASSNPKLHFFFIDYEAEKSRDIINQDITQAEYLTAATNYFRNHQKILSHKSKGLYIIITKADSIPGNTEEEKLEEAKRFIEERFLNFYDLLREQSKNFNMDFGVKMFSIGDLYFNRICRINREYSDEIIQTIHAQVPDENTSVFRKFLKK